MKKYLTCLSRAALVAVTATALCLVSTAKAADEAKMDSKAKSNLSVNDKKFLKKAYKGGMTEVANAKVAKEKAKDDATKEIADRIDPRDEPGVTHPAAHQFDGGCGHRGVDLARDAAGGGLVIELS